MEQLTKKQTALIADLINDYVDWFLVQPLEIKAKISESERILIYLKSKPISLIAQELFKPSLSLTDLQNVCDIRSREAFKMGDDVPISEWAMSLAGELGELCNLLAKLDRAKRGALDAGNSIKVEDITMDKIAEEIGGIMIYLAILSRRLRIDLEKAVIKTFDEKSVKIGYPVTLNEQRYPVLEPVLLEPATNHTVKLTPPDRKYKGGIGNNNIEQY